MIKMVLAVTLTPDLICFAAMTEILCRKSVVNAPSDMRDLDSDDEAEE